jgi:hypothetical protein
MVGAQVEPSVSFENLDGAQVMSAIGTECYEAGLLPEMPAADILDCSGVIEERFVGGAPANEDRIVVTHRLRFTLLEREEAGRVAAEAWTETEELGNVIEQPVTAEEYLRRVQRVLTSVVARQKSPESPPWAGRFDSEQAWHLQAHLDAVSHCNANLASMTAESVAADSRSIGLRPLGDDTRDRCEQLHTYLFEWGLARGDADPTVAEYARYRAALPPDRRPCTGLLAPDAVCPP